MQDLVVLVFSQDDGLRGAITRTLARAAARPVAVSSLSRAVEFLQADVRPALAVVARGFDPGEADELAAWLRRRDPALPIVLIGAVVTAPRGLVEHLHTPFGPSELLAVAHRALDKAGSAQATRPCMGA